MRLRVFASRVVNHQLCTRLLYTSEPKPDDTDDGIRFFYGRPLLHGDETFANDEYRITPALQVTCHTVENDDFFPWTLRWDYGELTLSFEICYPESHADPMTADQLLRYLEYCVPWSMGS